MASAAMVSFFFLFFFPLKALFFQQLEKVSPILKRKH